MAETERILNERPLTRQEDHPNDLEPLTPNKLLLLRSEQPPPLGSWVVADKFSKRWRQAQQLASAFWKRWVKEYLPLLQERQKWPGLDNIFSCLRAKFKMCLQKHILFRFCDLNIVKMSVF